jgi:hypothetical protein
VEVPRKKKVEFETLNAYSEKPFSTSRSEAVFKTEERNEKTDAPYFRGT